MKPYFFKGIPSEKALKPQSFHLEDTHLIDRNKLAKLLAILAIAFVWCCKGGIWLNEKEPIRILKKTGKRLYSFFKYGFGYIQHLLLNLLKKQELKYVFTLLSLYGSQIYKSMAKILYPDFMENTAAYDAAENMWKEVLDALATEHGFSHAPYLDTRLSNGEKERDANPFYNTYVASLNRAIRILQITKKEVGDLHICGWVDTFELEEDQPPIHELVISLVLSEETKAIAEQFIHAWLVEQVDEESMDRLVEARMILVVELVNIFIIRYLLRKEIKLFILLNTPKFDSN